MSCVTQTFNCTLTWIIENVSVFLMQMGHSFCVPEAELETFNSVKFFLRLTKEQEEIKFQLCKSTTNVSEQFEADIDFRVSIVGTDGSLHCSTVQSGVKFGNGMTQVTKCLSQLDRVIAMKESFFPKDILTLRIEMRFCGSNPLVLCSTVRTKMKIERCSLKWDLQKFSNIDEGNSLSTSVDVHLDKSPSFSLVLSERNLVTSFIDSVQNSNFQIELIKRSGSKHRHLANVDGSVITVEDCDLLVCCNISYMNGQHRALCSHQWFFFTSRNIDDTRIIPMTNHHFSYLDDLIFELSFADGKHGSLLEAKDFFYPSSESKLLPVAKNSVLGHTLLQDQKFMDVALKVGNRTFKAHKAVLSSVSPVFNAMFDHVMNENITGIVCIEDIEADTLQSMLRFIYTDAVDDSSFDQVARLFAAADKYEIDSLKFQCSALLISMLRPENLCRVLYLAYLHSDEEMKKAAKVFLCENPAEVLESKEWTILMDNCIRGIAAKPSTTFSTTMQQVKKSISTLRQSMRSKILQFHRRG